MSKQYKVIEEIKVLEELSVGEDAKSPSTCETMIQMADVTDITHFKCALPRSCQDANTDDQSNIVNGSCRGNKNTI